MLKKMFGMVKENIKKSSKAIKAAAFVLAATVFAASNQAHAATPVATSNNPDLDSAANTLIGGVGDMKTDGLVIIGVCIVVFVAIFGIGWLIKIVRKKMAAAS